MKYKKILLGITVAFVCLLIFLTFFSRTLADMKVPSVTLDFARQGTISPEARSTGLVRAADSDYIFAPVSGRITQIAEIGETVTGDTVLFTITSDLRTLSESLERAEHDRRVISLNIERAQSELAAEQQQLIRDISSPVSMPTEPVFSTAELDFQFDNNERALILQLEANHDAIERAREELGTLEILYDEGVIPRQSVDDGYEEIERLVAEREQIVLRHEQTQEQVNFQREQAALTYENAMAAYEDAVASAERSHQTQIESRRNRISQLEFNITAFNLDMERNEGQIADLSAQIADGGVMEVTLPPNTRGSRTVTEYMAGVSVGSPVSEGSAVMLTSLNNNRFIIEVSFPQALDFIDIDQSVDVRVGTERYSGTTVRITPQGGMNKVLIEMQSRNLRGGESADVVISAGTTTHQHVIPLTALREDDSGYFILYVEAEHTFFGTNYYLAAQRVDAGRQDITHIAISGLWGLDIPEEPIVVNSDGIIRAGERVKIAE